MNGSLADSINLLHLTVASLASYICRYVPLMAEVDKVRQIVDFDPLYGTPLFPKTDQLLDLLHVFTNGLVTSHAQLHGWYSCHNGSARIDMAVNAVDFIIACMELMTEINGLHGSRLAGVNRNDGNQYR